MYIVPERRDRNEKNTLSVEYCKAVSAIQKILGGKGKRFIPDFENMKQWGDENLNE